MYSWNGKLWDGKLFTMGVSSPVSSKSKVIVIVRSRVENDSYF